MTTSFDTETLTLLEEHVRRLLSTMGFTQITVHCRSQAPVTPTPPVAQSHEDTWLNNAALNTYQSPTALPRQASVHEELLLTIEAGDDGKLLIGMQGAHLEALQHVMRMVLRRQLGQPAHVVVDVNGYRARREEGLVQQALGAARRAKTTGRTVTLAPMSATDRRVIHATLAQQRGVGTESIGDEPNRRVVVRPVF